MTGFLSAFPAAALPATALADSTVGVLAAHLWASTLVAFALLLVTVAARRWLAATSRHALLLVASLQTMLPVVVLRHWAAGRANSPPAPAAIDWAGFDVPLPALPAVALEGTSSGAALVLLVAWLAGVVVVAALAARAHRRLGRLTRASRPAGGRERALLAVAAARAGLATAPQLRLAEVPVPLVVGLLRPRILLPVDLVARLGDDELAAILAHEAAHARRRDPLAAALQLATLACWWFHPLAWLLESRARRERELACDEAALAAGVAPRTLLAALLAAGRHAAGPRLAAAAGLTGSITRRRKEGIMAQHRSPLRLSHRLACASAALATLLALAVWPLPGAAAGQGQVRLGPDDVGTGFAVSPVTVGWMVEAIVVDSAGRVLTAPRIAVAPGEEATLRSGTKDADGRLDEVIVRVELDAAGRGTAAWERLRDGVQISAGEAPLAPRDETDEGDDVSLSLRDAELARAVEEIARLAGMTVVASEPLAGTVTVELDRVPWERALREVLGITGHAHRRLGSYLLVYPES